MITDQQKREWIYNLSNLPMKPWPFAHCALEQTIPIDLYAEMMANMPPHEEFVLLSSTGRIGKGAYPQRFIHEGEYPGFWASIRDFLLTREFGFALARPYTGMATQLAANPTAWTMDTLLIEDLPGYRIGPHADAPHKVLSALFYLGTGTGFLECPGWGTSLYTPKFSAADVDPRNGRHYEFADFNRIATMPYRLNHGLSFVKSDTSWHGVEEIPEMGGERRIVLLADIKAVR